MFSNISRKFCHRLLIHERSQGVWTTFFVAPTVIVIARCAFAGVIKIMSFETEIRPSPQFSKQNAVDKLRGSGCVLHPTKAGTFQRLTLFKAQ
jgi:hypothetical protein